MERGWTFLSFDKSKIGCIEGNGVNKTGCCHFQNFRKIRFKDFEGFFVTKPFVLCINTIGFASIMHKEHPGIFQSFDPIDLNCNDVSTSFVGLFPSAMSPVVEFYGKSCLNASPQTKALIGVCAAYLLLKGKIHACFCGEFWWPSPPFPPTKAPLPRCRWGVALCPTRSSCARARKDLTEM